MLLDALLASQVKDGRTLLTAALQVWLTNIIVFGLAFWELDRGGPVCRTQAAPRRTAARRLPVLPGRERRRHHRGRRRLEQGSGWVPALHDYLYVSLTNSTAFSPTDTMPLTWRAKLLMGVESTSALIVSILVISRGVSILQ